MQGINKYSAEGFAERLKRTYPDVYDKPGWTIDEINENWLLKHPEHLIHLIDDDKNRYSTYDSDTQTTYLKTENAQAIVENAERPDELGLSGQVGKMWHNIKSLFVKMPETGVAVPAIMREGLELYHENVVKGGLRHQLTQKDTYKTLSQYLSDYAPPEDGNNTSKYTKDIANELNVNPDISLRKLDTEKLSYAIAKYEGWLKKPQPIVAYDESGERYLTGELEYTLGQRNNNPGNLRVPRGKKRLEKWTRQFGMTEGEGGFAKFPSAALGYGALRDHINSDKNVVTESSNIADNKIEEFKKNPAIKFLNAVADASLNVSENMRMTTDGWTEDWIKDSPELQAYYAWREDNPYKFKDLVPGSGKAVSSLVHGFTDFAPSIISMMSPRAITGGLKYGVKAAGYFDKIKKSNKAKKLNDFAENLHIASEGTALPMMFAIEGSSQYNEAMKMLVDDMGWEPENAIGVAGASAAIYAPLSTLMEKLQFNNISRGLGLSKRADQIMLSNIMNMVAKGSPKELNRIARQDLGKRVLLGGADYSLNLMENYLVEGAQQWLSVVTTEAMNQGYGLEPEGALNEYLKSIPISAWEKKQGLLPFLSEDKEVQQSALSALFGSMGMMAPRAIGMQTKAFKRFNDAIKIGKDNGFKVNISEDNAVTITNKKDEIISVFQASSFEEAQEVEKEFITMARETATEKFVNKHISDTDTQQDLDDFLNENEIDIEEDPSKYETIEGYILALTNQLKDVIPNVNKNISKTFEGLKNLNPLQQLIYNGLDYDNSVGQKLFHALKFKQDPNFLNTLLDNGDIDADLKQQLDADMWTYARGVIERTVKQNIKKGQSLTDNTVKKIINKAMTLEDVLSHVVNNTFRDYTAEKK
jgi:hypothetical protein